MESRRQCRNWLVSIFFFCLFLKLKTNLYSSELQAINDDSLNKLYENQDRIDASREWLLQDRAGVAPRMYYFDMDSVSS